MVGIIPFNELLVSLQIQEELPFLYQHISVHSRHEVCTFVGTFGTIITYLIVLLQFKVSEKASTESESNLATTVSTLNTTTVWSNSTLQ